jgi:hypothetical protein
MIRRQRMKGQRQAGRVLWGQTAGKKLFRRTGMPKASGLRFNQIVVRNFSLVNNEVQPLGLLRNTSAISTSDRPPLAQIMLLGKDAVEPFELRALY